MNTGKAFELELVNYLHKKTYYQLNKNFQRVFIRMFGKPSRFHRIKAFLYEDKLKKPDIVIVYRKVRKLISVKTNSSQHVHMESIKSFILFLRELGLSTESQKDILLYQYGDGTLNGTGKERIDFPEILYVYENEILRFNKEINSNKDLVIKCMNRFIFQGTSKDNEIVDYIYHGDLDIGILCSREQILKHISRRSFDKLKNPHIGPLLFFPYARYANKNIAELHPEKRHYVNLKWPKLPIDLRYIERTYD